MTEFSPLSPEESVKTGNDKQQLRPASPSSIQVTDDFIFENRPIMDHINKIRTQLNGETRPQEPGSPIRRKTRSQWHKTSHQKKEFTGTKHRKSTKEGTRQRWFCRTPRHMTRRAPKDTQDTRKSVPISNNFSLPSNPTNSTEVADERNPEQVRKPRIPPFFVKCTRDWGSLLPQLKIISPNLTSVLTRGNFLKITVSTEVEHLRMKNKLLNLGLDFKCFNLKKDRPIKVMIRGYLHVPQRKTLHSH
ncbi:hypothetical protein CEXT_739281 [Caerostris extrusa]|uniref:Uncharacterized protein n=1 Tax=Caerostris extrusa TaxID=172846 RepID=A0AAV4UMS1_CAEEX|nr:hypothetical protein CEXT_739281 [Caerostris extrusa]